MQKLLNYLRGDRIIWLVVLILGILGVLVVYSSSTRLAYSYRDGNTEFYLVKHLLILLVGLFLTYVLHLVDYRLWQRVSLFGLLGSWALLLLVFTQAPTNGAYRFIDLGFVSFQPSEVAKLALIIHLAGFLARRQEAIKDFRRTLRPALAMIGVTCLLIAINNLSTGLVLFTVCLFVLYIAGSRVKHLMALAGIGLLGVTLLVSFARRSETWQNRVGEFKEQVFNADSLKPGEQPYEARIALAHGGLVGAGPGRSVQRHYLPQSENDYIFAIVAEEYGLLGALVVLFLFGTLLFRMMGLITVAPPYGSLLVAGLSLLLLLQSLVHMGVSVGLLPVTGLPLPLLSSGGTATLFVCIALGIILGVSRKLHEQPAAA